MEMPKGQKPDDEVSISQKGADDKDHNTKVGLAWNAVSDGIFVKLAALPLDGSLGLFPPKTTSRPLQR
jgi:hypothetical protein